MYIKYTFTLKNIYIYIYMCVYQRKRMCNITTAPKANEIIRIGDEQIKIHQMKKKPKFYCFSSIINIRLARFEIVNIEFKKAVQLSKEKYLC